MLPLPTQAWSMRSWVDIRLTHVLSDHYFYLGTFGSISRALAFVDQTSITTNTDRLVRLSSMRQWYWDTKHQELLQKLAALWSTWKSAIACAWNQASPTPTVLPITHLSISCTFLHVTLTLTSPVLRPKATWRNVFSRAIARVALLRVTLHNFQYRRCEVWARKTCRGILCFLRSTYNQALWWRAGKYSRLGMYNVDPEVRFWATPPYHEKLLADPAWANGHGCT